jgi:hypothetical protein
MSTRYDDDDSFNQMVADTIYNIIDTIENHDPAGIIDIEVANDIITFTLPEDRKYVLNKHTNYKEIWLVSPFSGPYHFKYLRSTWIDQNNVVLADLLAKELSQFINKIKFHL